jgi:hypothetical protein
VGRTRLFLVAAALLALILRAPVAAHEIPAGVTVHVFVKPEGNRLRVLVRAPLGAMRDIQFPRTRDGFLDVARAEPDLLDAVARWILPTLRIMEGGDRLEPPAIVAARVSLPSDRSFASYDSALAHVTGAPPSPKGSARQGPLPDAAHLPPEQALLDTLLEYPIRAERSDFAIQPGFERLGIQVVTALRFVSPDGVRAFELRGDPGLVRLDPRWHQAAWQFVRLGFVHILDGIDHLLFLFCLVVPLRRLRPLILVVTAFTVAHSMTLIASALGFAPDALWFPRLVETLIAASIVYLALENIVTRGAAARRWIVAFAFGLVHGFGFSFALKETLQLAGSHLLTSLFAFNVGVEIGQILVLVALVPALQILFRFVVAERIGVIVLSALAAHTAWHWMAERWQALRQFPAPALDPGVVAIGARVLLAIVALYAVAWLTRRSRGRLTAPAEAAPDPQERPARPVGGR